MVFASRFYALFRTSAGDQEMYAVVLKIRLVSHSPERVGRLLNWLFFSFSGHTKHGRLLEWLLFSFAGHPKHGHQGFDAQGPDGGIYA